VKVKDHRNGKVFFTGRDYRKSESQIQKEIIDFLDTQGFWTVKVIQANKSGCPDVLAADPNNNAIFTAFEVKKPGGKPSKLQLHQLDQIRKTGARAYIVESVDEVKQILGLA